MENVALVLFDLYYNVKKVQNVFLLIFAVLSVANWDLISYLQLFACHRKFKV